MYKSLWIFLGVFLSIIISANQALCLSEKTTVSEEILKDLDSAIAEAKLKKGDLLSPDNFANAQKAYMTAKESMKTGKNETAVKKEIDKAQSYIKKVDANIELSKLTLGQIIAARENAIAAAAPEYALDQFKKADELFIQAAKHIEEGNVNRARRVAEKAQPLFRSAEKTALKEGLLGDAKRLEAEAKKLDVDTYAPKALSTAGLKLKEVEKYIGSDEYHAETAKTKAQEAKYRYEHAIKLAEEIKETRKKKWTNEDIYFSFESEIAKLSAKLGLPSGHDKNLTRQIEEIAAAVERNKKDREDLNLRFSKSTIEYQNKLSDLNTQINEKDKEIARLKGKTEEEAERLNALRMMLERENQAREKYETINALFKTGEGRVLKDGTGIILQLYGLTFPSGKSTIQAESYDLLSKVQKSIREYPSAKIIIEGHTDSVGDGKFNEILSEERAKSVKAYLVANNTVEEEKVDAVGYGSSKPVASNKTQEGRAKNRRIDIIIKTDK